MGMFDSFILKSKCPFCGNEGLFEFQTKSFGCHMYEWKKGDEIQSGDIIIKDGLIKNCTGSCAGKKCNAYQKKKDKYQSGFGRIFHADVIIKNNVVMGVAKIYKRER